MATDYRIGFRVVRDKWYNRIFPFTTWECVVETEEDMLETIHMVKSAIDNAVLNDAKRGKKE